VAGRERFLNHSGDEFASPLRNPETVFMRIRSSVMSKERLIPSELNFYHNVAIAKAQQATPHKLPSQDVAQGGVQLGVFLVYYGTEPNITPIDANTTLLDHDGIVLNGEWRGMAVAKRDTTGQIGLNIAFGQFDGIGLNISPA